MAKIRLNPDALQVESFCTEALQMGHGTVQGMQGGEPAEGEAHTTTVTPIITEWKTCKDPTCNAECGPTGRYYPTCHVPTICTCPATCPIEFEPNQPADFG